MNVLILGAGNMASSLIPKSFNKIAHSYFVTTPGGESALKFANNFGISNLDYKEALKKLRNGEFDILWLAMKPQSFLEFGRANDYFDCPELEVVSILAAIEASQIAQVFNHKNIIRLMPNTPTQYGLGVNPLWCKIESDLVLDLLEDFNKVGVSFIVESEEGLDQITPFSGSGPAYFFEIARILQNKLKSYGFSEEISRIVIGMTMKGSAQMILESKESLLNLRENVTSKKGVTFEALKVFEDSALESIISRAIERALDRIEELRLNK